MKIIEKISLTIFSIIILILSLILCLMLFSWLDVSYIYYFLNLIILNPTATNITLAISVILLVLSALCIFFPSDMKEKENKIDGLLLENESGKLMISIETIENIVKGVVSSFSNARMSSCKVKLDKQVNNIIIELNIIVTAETVIKELSLDIQNKIKDTIKKTTDIDVKSINIKIKNIETPKEQV